MTGHSLFQTFSTSSAKAGKMAKGRLVASDIFQELLEELVLPHCESVDKIRIFSNMLWSECDCIKRETSLISSCDMVLVQGSGCILLTIAL